MSESTPMPESAAVPGMSDRFSQRWLETLCSLLPDVDSAVFMVPDADNDGLHLLARWPNGLDQPRDFFDSVKYADRKSVV